MARPAARWTALLIGALLGCPTGAGDDDSAGDDDDVSYEPGCITVNGVEPGFARLQDAIATAAAGDEIQVCDGEFEGSVVVEIPLTIRGEGPEDTVLVGDVNEMAVTIRDTADVTLSGFTIETSRDGVAVEASTGVVLEDLVVASSGQVGISADDSELRVADCELRDHPYAAVDVRDSTLVVTGSRFADLTGYGVRVRSSDARIEDSEFEGVVPQPESDDTDGSCVFADDSQLAIDAVEIAACTRVGVYAFDSDLALSSTTIRDCGNGVAGIGGSDGSSVVDSTIDQVPLFGVLLVDQDAVVSGNTIQSSDPTAEGFGVAVGGDNGEFEIRDNQVSGFGQIGIWVQYALDGTTPTGGDAVVTGNTISDAALYGALVTSLDTAEVADNRIDGVTWGGELSDGGYVDGFGLNLWDIDELTLSGNEVVDVDVVGIYLRGSSFTSVDDQVGETGVWGILVTESSGTFDGLLVNNTSIFGVDARTSSLAFVDAVLRNAQQGVPPEYWEDGWPVYYYAYAALFSDSQCSFVDSWFLDNQDYTLALDATDVLVEGTTFRGGATYGVYSVYGFGEIRDSSFEDLSYAIHLDSADAASQIGDLTVADNLFSGVYSAVYGSSLAGTTVFDGNQVEATTGPALYLADSTPGDAWIEVRDSGFTDLAASAVYASGIDLTVSGCDLVGAAGPNLDLRDSTVQVIDNPAISQSAGAGIKLGGVIGGSITGNTIQDNGAHGIHCDSPDVSLDACENAMAGNVPDDLYEENGCSLACSVQ